MIVNKSDENNSDNKEKYYKPVVHEENLELSRRIRGDRVLKDIFREIALEKLTYQKTIHSLALTKWLIENSPESLKEISNVLQQVIELM